MKVKKKAIAQSIATEVESTLSASIDLTKKEKSVIEKSAKKLAKKITKHLKKVEEKDQSTENSPLEEKSAS